MLRSHTLGFLLACSASLSAQGLGYWKKMPSLQIPRQEVGAAVIGGKIYVTGENGFIVVLQQGPKLKYLAKNDVGESCVATAAWRDSPN